ncbi:MAG: hypothetical protein U0Z44_16050 [Kouleothrix sp.]
MLLNFGRRPADAATLTLGASELVPASYTLTSLLATRPAPRR